jgi:hypothetical protein
MASVVTVDVSDLCPSSLRLIDVVGRVTHLQPAYARAVRRALAQGSGLEEAPVGDVDAAREAASRRLASCRAGRATEREAIESL